MGERGAGKKAEMPERLREAGGGTADVPEDARQAPTAHEGATGDGSAELMEEVLRRKNMLAAYERVVRNGGAPGVDGMTVKDLMTYCRKHWARTREELLGGRYRPQPVRRVDIPKPDGKGTRTLGIPTVMDRMIQQALLQVLQPIFDPGFSDASFGFRPRRSTHGAVVRAREHVAAGNRWVVDLDLEKFFDRVNHDVLLARVARRVKDKRVLLLIRRFLQAGMMEGGLVSPRTEGTPQGGPLSPLLSNVLLDELDKELERRGHRFVRYADDCNVYVQSEAAGQRVMASLERFLAKRLRLKVNREKSAVARPWERKFLGYTVSRDLDPKLKVAPKSVERLKGNLRATFRAGRGRDLRRVLTEVNGKTRGWVAYYRLADATYLLRRLDSWLHRKVRGLLWRRWKTPRTRARMLRRCGVAAPAARAAAYSNRGPWRSAAFRAMHQAVPNVALDRMGLLNLCHEHRRLAGRT